MVPLPKWAFEGLPVQRGHETRPCASMCKERAVLIYRKALLGVTEIGISSGKKM